MGDRNTGLKLTKYYTLLIIGGLIYYGIELLWRGYSHWSMVIVGGICFILIGLINHFFTFTMPLWKQCGIAALIVLVVEFISGCILNIWLNLNVWDYSQSPFNVLGQICLPYAIIWFFLSSVAIILDDVLRWKLFGEETPHYTLF